MNLELHKARSIAAENARRDLEQLRLAAKGGAGADADELAARVERTIRMLERAATDMDRERP
jgi:hypothetical protein